MFKKIRKKEGKQETVQSYLGIIGHGNGCTLKKQIALLVEEIRS